MSSNNIQVIININNQNNQNNPILIPINKVIMLDNINLPLTGKKRKNPFIDLNTYHKNKKPRYE